jgi:F-type H+-transporting ATPase subunit b
MKEILSAFSQGLLAVSPGLAIWTAISFLLLFLILWRFAWKPIVSALDARADRIRKDLETAASSRKEAEEMFYKHKSMIEYARDEALKIVGEGRGEAEQMKAEILEKANLEANEMIQRAKREIDLAREKAVQDIKSEIVNISTEIASKIIERNLKPEDQKALVENELTRLM